MNGVRADLTGLAGGSNPPFPGDLRNKVFIDYALRDGGSVLGLMPALRLWEWVVDHGADRDQAGVSGTRHGAMTALSRTLVKAGAPASGRVVPMALVDGARGVSYLRMEPALTADCDKGVIRWS